jgi:hypothetical protein
MRRRRRRLSRAALFAESAMSARSSKRHTVAIGATQRAGSFDLQYALTSRAGARDSDGPVERFGDGSCESLDTHF